MTHNASRPHGFVLALLAFALAVRAIVPTGWMPTGERAFAITICAGIETQTVWMDRSGAIHQTDPSKPEHQDEAAKEGCAFAGLTLPMLAAPLAFDFEAGGHADAVLLSLPYEIAIGRGLAAPPPPSTGPPVLS